LGPGGPLESDGAHAFTVGQRRGLQLGVPAPDGKPRFVLEVRPVNNTVVVGPKEALACAEISGDRFTWAGRAPSASTFDCHAQIRAHADPVPATATWENGTLTVRPDEPFDGVAPGQTAVLYDGTRVIGQFTIARTVSAVPVEA
ncbi:aminomethyltransferase beta-barrel domain-containing protein, partial [Microbacterium sp. B19]|uniref:aminomethyltransferase beta-barrel domain-containing protein n=1 Tax=Microbacterium sp. B19 TaxID=96765 RepID=UPI0003B4BC74